MTGGVLPRLRCPAVSSAPVGPSIADHSDGMTPVERAAARDEIRQLAYRYADAVDRRDIDLMVSLFAPDARFGAYGAGPEACRRLSEESLARVGVAVLMVTNHLIDFEDAGNAYGAVWCHAHVDDHAERFIEQLIKYEDRYVLLDDGWRFARRRHLLWYGAATGRSPLDQPVANWPAQQVGRGSIPYDDPAWQAFWAGRGPV